MSDRIIVIISTAEAAKARTGAMYAVNALKHGWLEDVKLFFFGPAEELLLEDAELQQYVKAYQETERTPIACKFLADRAGSEARDDGRASRGPHVSAAIAALGVDVQYVGKPISDLIKQGYLPMVW